MYLYASQGLGAPTTVSWGFGGGLLTSETMGSPGEASGVGVDVVFLQDWRVKAGRDTQKGITILVGESQR